MSYLLGPDAHVSIEKYVAPYLHRTYHQGANYRAQIASMYLYTDPVRKTAVLPAGAIALVDGKLDQLDQIVAILDSALKTGAKSLTVVAASFSDEVIGVMVRNSRGAANAQNGKNGKNGKSDQDKARKLTITGVKFKDVGDERREAYDDLAMLTGATVLGRAWSKPVEMVGPEDLGRCRRRRVRQRVVDGGYRNGCRPPRRKGGRVAGKAGADDVGRRRRAALGETLERCDRRHGRAEDRDG